MAVLRLRNIYDAGAAVWPLGGTFASEGAASAGANTANLRDMLSILDRHLASNEYFGGAYSIADMTMYSDVHLHGMKDIGLTDYPNLKRWHDAIEARPAIQRAWGPFPT